MGWNDSDDNDNKKDPWSGKNQGPPDLDEAFRKLQKKLTQALNGKKGSSNLNDQDNGGGGLLVSMVIIVALIFWALSGIFIVGAAEQAAITRFGKYVETVGPGPHWIPRFIDSAIIKNVDKRSKYTYSAQMLTKDENIVQVSVSVIYRIDNLQNYLFNVSSPVESLKQATASSLRQVVGHTTLDDILTKGRELWGTNVEKLLSDILADYKTGIVVVNVAPQPARAPETVQGAFDDAITAQEDEKRFTEKAKSYKEKVVPIAKGKAKRILSEAQADAESSVLKAEGAVADFLALLPQFNKAPDVVRERMYLSSMEKVLSQSSKILIDKSSGNLLYLPLEKLMSAATSPKAADPNALEVSVDEAPSSTEDTHKDNSSTNLMLRSPQSYGRYGSRL